MRLTSAFYNKITMVTNSAAATVPTVITFIPFCARAREKKDEKPKREKNFNEQPLEISRLYSFYKFIVIGVDTTTEWMGFNEN